MDSKDFAKNTLDEIPSPKNNAKHIIGLIKENGRITGYRLSDNTSVAKDVAVNMARQGEITGVGIAHNGSTQYLKAIPDGTEKNNLGNLPTY